MSMTMLLEQLEDKSTIGRSQKAMQAPAVIRATLGAIGAAAPRATSRFALSMFMRPRRKAVPRREREWIRDAEPLSFDVDGARLAGWSVGRGPTVLLVHGWGGRGSQLGAFVEPLLARGYRVVGYDGPGHGGSEGRRSSLPAHAAGVLAVGRAVGPVHAVIAHSFGTAATTLAVRDGLRVERCAYVSPPASMRYFVEVFCDALGFPESVGDEMTWRIERRFGINFASLDGPAIARTTALPPVLIAHDEDDLDVPLVHASTLAEAWPGAKLMVTSGLGHRAILRDAQVVQSLVRFVDSCG